MYRLLLAALISMFFSTAGHAVQLHSGSEIKVPVSTKLMIYERIGNASVTFDEGDFCTSDKEANRLIVDAIRGGYVIARYYNVSSYAPGNECPNTARILVPIEQANMWLQSYATKSESEFTTTFQLWMQGRRKGKRED